MSLIPASDRPARAGGRRSQRRPAARRQGAGTVAVRARRPPARDPASPIGARGPGQPPLAGAPQSGAYRSREGSKVSRRFVTRAAAARRRIVPRARWRPGSARAAPDRRLGARPGHGRVQVVEHTPARATSEARDQRSPAPGRPWWISTNRTTACRKTGEARVWARLPGHNISRRVLRLQETRRAADADQEHRDESSLNEVSGGARSPRSATVAGCRSPGRGQKRPPRPVPLILVSRSAGDSGAARPRRRPLHVARSAGRYGTVPITHRSVCTGSSVDRCAGCGTAVIASARRRRLAAESLRAAAVPPKPRPARARQQRFVYDVRRRENSIIGRSDQLAQVHSPTARRVSHHRHVVRDEEVQTPRPAGRQAVQDRRCTDTSSAEPAPSHNTIRELREAPGYATRCLSPPQRPAHHRCSVQPDGPANSATRSSRAPRAPAVQQSTPRAECAPPSGVGLRPVSGFWKPSDLLAHPPGRRHPTDTGVSSNRSSPGWVDHARHTPASVDFCASDSRPPTPPHAVD